MPIAFVLLGLLLLARSPAAAVEGGTVVDIDYVALSSGGEGVYVTHSDGTVESGDGLPHFGDKPTLNPGEAVIALSVRSATDGYWLFTNRGRAFAFGAAQFHGDAGGLALAAPMISAIATPDGLGYYMVAEDGGIFTYGTATFYGSIPQVLPGVELDARVIGIVPSPTGKGYLLIAADGGIFTFGDAKFFGSIPGVLPGVALDAEVVAVIAQPNGYLMVAADGGIFAFGTAAFHGSLGGEGKTGIIGVAVKPDNSGYVMADSFGTLEPFGSFVPSVNVDDYLPGDNATELGFLPRIFDDEGGLSDELGFSSELGAIEVGGDRDRFETWLETDSAYHFALNERGGSGSGALADPLVVGVFDKAGDLVFGASSDDSRFNDEVGLFIVTEPGYYEVEVASASTDGTGEYELVLARRRYSGPVIDVPADITVDATSVAGAPVTFSAKAFDFNRISTPACAPASGSTFPVGTTTVTCTTANHRESASAEFTVTVQTAGTFTVVERELIWCIAELGTGELGITLESPDVEMDATTLATLVLSFSGAGSISHPTNGPDDSLYFGNFSSFGITDMSGQTVTVTSLVVDGIPYAVDWSPWVIPNVDSHGDLCL